MLATAVGPVRERELPREGLVLAMLSVRVGAVARVFAVSLALSACAGQDKHDLLAKSAVTVTPSEISGRHTIYAATTRQKAEDPREVFDGQRSDSTYYVRVDMTVPAAHKIGSIELPKRDGPPDPAKYFTAVDLASYDGAASFRNAVGVDIARHGDRVLVFVHGYNNGFDDGVYRITQLVHDMKFPGSAVLFSWASAAKVTDYVYDRDSANAARDELEATLKLLAATGVQNIDIIAHSMGTFLTMEALRQLAIEGNRDLGGKLKYVVLASPDIDVDVFKKQMRRYGKPRYPFAVLLSSDDKALALSRLVAGDKPRVGDDPDAAKDLAELGVVVVDLSKSAPGSDDRLKHAKFADNPILVQLLGERLLLPAGLAPDESSANDSIDRLARGLGETVASVAQIVITTPTEVLNVGN
jgi:esterase/lipase superfamily enzyme